MKLMINAAVKLLFGALLIGMLLFLPAGTLLYFGAWLFLAVLFIPMTAVGIVLAVKAPALLSRRLDHREKEKTQRGVIGIAGLMFPVGFVVSALDFRFGWSACPVWASIAGAALFLTGYAMYAEVLRENAYLSRTVRVEEGQTVVSTGLYGIVRHPMYLSTLLMFLPIPLILSSLWGLIPFALYPVLIVVRIFDEEKVLSCELAGYTEYKTCVKYRLIPFVW